MERFCIDTNVLFSFFWKGSWVRDIIFKPDVILFSPEKVLEEVDKHSSEIFAKANIGLDEYKLWRTTLSLEVVEVKFDEFKHKLSEAAAITPDEKDVELFAVALLYDMPLWSNEARLKKQKKVKVFSNEEMFKKFGFK